MIKGVCFMLTIIVAHDEDILFYGEMLRIRIILK